MNRLFNLTLLIGLFLCGSSCSESQPGHPRILLLRGEEKAIQQAIAESETWGKLHQALMDECENILLQEPMDRIQIGRRLLHTSREYLRRIFYLSYGYRMTGDRRYAEHAVKEMVKASGFTDWNPSHFLDVGEMTMALAIGYDWLYDLLPDESKVIIREAIVEKGLNPSLDDEYNWFLEAEHNWNQVCNAGMTFGAMAVREDYPALADSIINRAFRSIPKAMVDYGPDGAYPEGYSYWDYGTTFNVLFLSAVEKYYRTDRGLSESPGFMQTADFMKHMLAPSGKSYNWGDCGPGGSFSPAMFWFAAKNNDPSLLWMEKKYLQTPDYSDFTTNRILPAAILWGKDIPLEELHEPPSTFYVAQGRNPVCIMRTSWSDPDAMYLGFKAGSPSVNHGHMDIGSFIMEANGIRWVCDFGSQNYESLESKGMSIFGRAQDAQRWTIFRLNNYAHSTLTVNNELQRVDGYAKIDDCSEAEEFRYAISDLSTLYRSQLKKAVRGIALVKESYVVIRDQIETPAQITTVRWNLVTPAEVMLTENGARLMKDKKSLYLKVKGPDQLTMRTWSTAPMNDYDAENPGTTMVGFECILEPNSTTAFEVLLIPEDKLEVAKFTEWPLEEW
jgi:hypothetical protein